VTQPRVVAALVLTALLAGGIAFVAGSGDDGGRAGDSPRVGWQGKPEVVSASNLPRDAIVFGRIRNNTLRPLDLEASDLVVVDDRGRRWRTSGRYMQGFAHGLWPPGGKVTNRSDGERERLGEIAKLDPGETAPLTLAWTKPRGAGRAVRIELGGPSLPVPAEKRGPGI